jgi:hypothetical protein
MDTCQVPRLSLRIGQKNRNGDARPDIIATGRQTGRADLQER